MMRKIERLGGDYMYSDNKLEWFVFVEDINRKRIKVYNIFEHKDFMEDCDGAWENYKNKHHDFSRYQEDIDGILMYYFWCKCEWEIILSNFPPSDSFQKKKIDVYQQVKINWKKFMDYLFSYYIANEFYLSQWGRK